MKKLFSIIIFLVSLSATGQYVPIGTPMQYQKIKVEKSIKLPSNLENLNAADSGSIAYNNGCLYVWMRGQWWQIACPDIPLSNDLAITSHPQAITVNDGEVASFSVTASGGQSPYTYQWQKDNVNIPGATSQTYSFTAGFSHAGAYRAIVTDNASATATSTSAILSVTQAMVATWGYFESDPYAGLLAGTDNLSYAGTVSISGSDDISIPFPEAASEKYWVIKVPSSVPEKTTWFNTFFNSGDIPDQVWQSSFVSGLYRYYVTRIPATLDFSQPVILQ